MTDDLIPPFIREWLQTLHPASLEDAAGTPSTTAIFSADMIVGFLQVGPLSSPRVAALADSVAELFQRAWDHGIRQFVLVQDSHDPRTPEFESYPPHCQQDTDEAQTIERLATLPFADAFTVIEKNSLNPAIATHFDDWLEMNRELTTAIVVGNCTDLCVYQLAMHLRMRANALNIAEFRVIVPIDAVQTFDIPIDPVSEAGAAHPGDFFHTVFLYHMAQNGIDVLTRLT